MRFGKLFVLTLILFASVEAIWLIIMTPIFYGPQLEALLAPEPFFPAAVGFYVVYISGVVLFAILPSLERRSVQRAVLLGAALGCFGYGTYDLTNWATIKDWPAAVVFVDMGWGMLLTGTMAGLVTFLGMKVPKLSR